ncbi:MAG: PH domain-containing protein [Balneolaceae bacterium]|nr:PH domain-containing protein [Balneolaceae bacterium]
MNEPELTVQKSLTEPASRINQNAIKAWRLSALLFGSFVYVIPGLLYLIFTLDGDMSMLYPIISAPSAVIIHCFFIFVLPKIRWKRWKYEVDDKGIDMQRGIIITKRTMVPINRIQHVDTRQGPIYRKYGLSSISLSTAATTHEIPALDENTASELREIISDLVRKVKEDV